MASPVSRAPIGRTQTPEPIRGRVSTTFCAEERGTVRDCVGSPAASPGPGPADENEDLF